MDISGFIFISVFMMTFGYIVGNARNITFWKFLPLAIVLIPFVHDFNLSKTHLMVVAVSFVIGYLLPYAYLLEGFIDHLSDAINTLRYKDAYEDIKRKEEEVEQMRREYQRAKQDANREKQEYERARRQAESEQYRQEQAKSEKQQKDSTSSSNTGSSGGYERKSNQQSQQRSTTPSSREIYCKILELDPDKSYTFKDIKKAYRQMAAKYHPDKHHDKGDDIVSEMTERFKEIKKAFEWMGVYGVA